VDTVFEMIKQINTDGMTILLVEQNARIALEYADRGYVFAIGKIAFEDKAKNLLENDEVRKLFLGEDISEKSITIQNPILPSSMQSG